jgi:hypothetical protein
MERREKMKLFRKKGIGKMGDVSSKEKRRVQVWIHLSFLLASFR